MSDAQRGNGNDDASQVPAAESPEEGRPGTFSLLLLVLAPFALMVVIAIFYYWMAR